MLTYVEVAIKNLRRLFNRSEWAIRLLGLSKLDHHVNDPGLVMVQIDGLSLNQFNRALHKKRMPFLSKLLTHERYSLRSFYSGLPSNTPAVQGEMMYGLKGCVPSFRFVDRQLGKNVKMMDTSYVEQFEARLRERGDVGLLKGGSSYSNIFTGDAAEAHFCWSQMGWGGVLHAINPFIFPLLIILYIDIFLRTFALLIIEFVIACVECVRGAFRGRMFSKELEFVAIRVLVCVFLRELIVTGVCMDIARGLPIIHLNFLGYDEQAHCRGPSSRYAHWTLQGIDHAIYRINQAIKESPYRSYDLWIYSDHGQETTTPYSVHAGTRVEDAVEKIFSQNAPPFPAKFYEKKFRDSRVQLLMRRREASVKIPPAPIDFEGRTTVVTAMGPMGQIYLNKKLTEQETDFYAQLLVSEAKIPLVLTRRGEKNLNAYTAKGHFILPEQAAEVLGGDHPFLDEAKEDMVVMCQHPDAGDFTICGWVHGQHPISFPLESGGHASPGTEETKGFALLPMDTPLRPMQKNYLRPIDIRNAALKFLKHEIFSFDAVSFEEAAKLPKAFSVMSYNVHGCRGMDGRMSIERIARVIARHNPDIVCLQELDRGRARSKGIDQAELLARKLEMHHHFHPTFRWKDEQRGNAILSRYPISLIKMQDLPQKADKWHYEPRGAIWVVANIAGKNINIINTHLSLWPKERLAQINALLGQQWLCSDNCQGPIILCGDFNAFPGSLVHQRVCQKLKDSQISGRKYRRGTYYGRMPVWQLDHIFVSQDALVESVTVPQTLLEKVASDHLPLILTIRFPDKSMVDVSTEEKQHG